MGEPAFLSEEVSPGEGRAAPEPCLLLPVAPGRAGEGGDSGRFSPSQFQSSPEPDLEIVLCSGYGKNGALSVLQVRPRRRHRGGLRQSPREGIPFPFPARNPSPCEPCPPDPLTVRAVPPTSSPQHCAKACPGEERPLQVRYRCHSSGWAKTRAAPEPWVLPVSPQPQPTVRPCPMASVGLPHGVCPLPPSPLAPSPAEKHPTPGGDDLRAAGLLRHVDRHCAPEEGGGRWPLWPRVLSPPRPAPGDVAVPSSPTPSLSVTRASPSSRTKTPRGRTPRRSRLLLNPPRRTARGTASSSSAARTPPWCGHQLGTASWFGEPTGVPWRQRARRHGAAPPGMVATVSQLHPAGCCTGSGAWSHLVGVVSVPPPSDPSDGAGDHGAGHQRLCHAGSHRLCRQHRREPLHRPGVAVGHPAAGRRWVLAEVGGTRGCCGPHTTPSLSTPPLSIPLTSPRPQ